MLKILTLSSILFFLNFNTNYSAADEYRQKLVEGVTQTFNFQFDNAERIFKELMKNNESDARSYVYMANIYVIQYLSDKRKSDFYQFEYYSEQAIKNAENSLKKNANDKDALYSLASINGYRTLVFLLTKKYIEGVWAAKKCLDYTNDLLEIDKNYIDAYLWKGLFDFALSQIPSSAKHVLKIVGIEGNFTDGIKGLRRTSENGILTSTEAKYFLSQIYSAYVNDNKTAEDLLQFLVEEFPKNILFKYSLASVKIKLRKIKEADELLNDILLNANTKFQNVVNLTYFLKGDCAYYQNHFNQAKPYYLRFIQKNSEENYKPTACFRLALSYELTGQKETAKGFFQMALDTKGETEDDIYSNRLANEYLKNGISSEEAQIILVGNYFQNNKFDLMVSSFDNLLKANASPEATQFMNFYFGKSNLEMNKLEEANKYFSKVSNDNGFRESWLIPYSKYYLGLINYKMGRKKETLERLNAAEKQSNYDFEKQLKAWVLSLKEIIGVDSFE
jgi:tetratricopeptide (TPR) repeat protein